ncbi:MAG: peptide-binding protein [Hyphomicrobiaceae bacterium]
MRSAFLAAAFVAALVAAWAMAGPAAAQYGSRCIVSDPTGTPLNIRARRQGRIIGSIRNGTYVRLVNIAYDALGRPWGYIVRWDTGRQLGWVFREFISCY